MPFGEVAQAWGVTEAVVERRTVPFPPGSRAVRDRSL